MKRLSIGFLLVTAGAAYAAGCGTGDISNTSIPKGADPGAVASSSPTTKPPVTNPDCVAPACQVFPLAANPHAVRLTNPQWENTVRDLLKLDVLSGRSSTFPHDPAASGNGFGPEAGDLVVTTDGWTAYQTAAEGLAKLVTTDPTMAMLNNILPDAAKDPGADQSTRIAAFVADFLPRAYRRPVTAKEMTDVTAAAEAAAAGVSTGDPFVVRVQWILTTVLQSPNFLYRIAFGEGAVKDKRARLSAYEVASKLSYGLWATMPDEGLAAKAKAGDFATPKGVADAAAAMLGDPRSQAAIAAFHDLLYILSSWPDELKNRPSTTFPNSYPEFVTDAQQDIRLSIQEIVLNSSGGVKDLQTSPIAFVNTRLAPIYGLDPANIPELVGAGVDVFAKIQMDPKQRKGILMHPGWLAYEGSPQDPSPIHRGAYMTRHLTCQPLGSPPPGAAATPIHSGKTNRERITLTTQGCGDGCHAGKGGIINPYGFSLEGFDSIGQLRTMDEGYPVDTTGSTDLLGPFSGALQLFDLASDNARVHACYAAHWSAFLNGTSVVDVTPKWLSPIIATSLKGGSVRDIIVGLVQTDAFLTVSVNGAP